MVLIVDHGPETIMTHEDGRVQWKLGKRVLVPSNEEKLLHLASREQAGKTRDCQGIIIAIKIMEKFQLLIIEEFIILTLGVYNWGRDRSR